MDLNERLENEIIKIIRVYFNDDPCKKFTTGFQRYCAKDIIEEVFDNFKYKDFDEWYMDADIGLAPSFYNRELRLAFEAARLLDED